jgi:pimeloyl-ACP methyl ester carboxylesterase
MNRQQILQTAFQSTFRLTETIAPPLAYRWAINLFLQPMKFQRPPREVALMQGATVTPGQVMPAASAAPLSYIQYSWGSGPTVLLVHGWAGRGSQMATFAAPLVAAGYRVVTFDAPAHGDAPGKRTNMVEVSQIVGALTTELGGVAAVVGHSFGGMATGYALRQGAPIAKLITVGSPATLDFVLSDFARQVKGSPRVTQALAAYITQLGQLPADSYSLTHALADGRVPALIVHDAEDRDVPVTQAHQLHAAWPGSTLHITHGLGHRRILRDDATIARIVAFISGVAEPRMTAAVKTTADIV